MGEEENFNIVEKELVDGYKNIQSGEAKWLCFNSLYGHFQRPNFYDIGGTCLLEVPDFWFLYRTEQVSSIYLLHLFVCKRNEGSFSISFSNGNELDFNQRSDILLLNSDHKTLKFENVPDNSHNYVTTYSFTELDVELIKDKKVLLSISLNPTKKETSDLHHYIQSLHDFRQLLSDPVGADFIIETGDGGRFTVHKIMLTARSEVFGAMLKGDTAENLNNHVKIDDVGKEDFGCVIEFLYTGTIEDLDNKNCFNLLMLADKYLIKGLKELAKHALSQLLSTDNALETLIVADMHNCPALKFAAFKFIKSNIASLDSSAFQEICNIQLVQELCKYLAVKY